MYSRGRGILDRLPLEQHLILISSIVTEKGDNADHDDCLVVLGPSDLCGQAGLLRGGLYQGGLGKGRLICFLKELNERKYSSRGLI